MELLLQGKENTQRQCHSVWQGTTEVKVEMKL